MSAICGVYSPGNHEFSGRPALDAMLAALTHHDGITKRSFVDMLAGVALGHIYEPSFLAPGEEPAPAWLETDRIVITLEGSIDDTNTERPSAGQTAYADAHTAAAARLQEQAPDDFPRGLKGYFSLAAWDIESRCLTLAADPLASKPLFVYHDPARRLLIFASELKAIYAHPAVQPGINPEALAAFLIMGTLRPPYSVQDGVSKLLPGEALSFDSDAGLSRRRHYTPPDSREGEGGFEEWTAAVREQVTRSVTRSTRATPAVAVMQSGGIDSNLVLAALKNAGVSQARAFTLFYTGQDTDLSWAGRLAKEIGVPHSPVEVRPEDTGAEALVRLVSQFDEPADPTRALTQHRLCQAALEAGLNSCVSGAESETLFGTGGLWPAFLSRCAAGEDPDAALLAIQGKARFLSFAETQRLLAAPPQDIESLPGRFYLTYTNEMNRDDPFDLLQAFEFLAWPYSRPGGYCNSIPRLSGSDVRPALRELELFEFSRTIPRTLRGSADREMDRALFAAAFADICPSINQKRAKYSFPPPPLYDPAFAGLRSTLLRGVELLKKSGLVVPKRVDRLVEKFEARPLTRSTGVVLKVWLLFGLFVWHQVNIEHRDPLTDLT